MTGKRRQKTVTIRGTKKEADAESTKLLHSIHTGAYVEPHKQTVADYLEQWLKDYASTNVAGKTFERYQEIIRTHLIPALGSIPLVKLQPMHVQAYYSRTLKEGRRDGKGGLSARTIRQHHGILREALQHAVRWQLLVKNPCDFVEPPKPQPKEAQVFSDEEIGRLLEAVKETWLYIPILLAYTTGMRRGEILALRWQDVDLKQGRLAVRQSLEETRQGLSFKQPKTQKGRRVVPLYPTVVDALHKHRAAQLQQRLMLQGGYQDQGLVCCRWDGNPLHPHTITSEFRGLAKKLSLSSTRFHDLRHSHATTLLRQQIHPKVVSERLGHSTIGITLDTYSHVLPDLQAEAVQKGEVALRAIMAASQ